MSAINPLLEEASAGWMREALAHPMASRVIAVALGLGLIALLTRTARRALDRRIEHDPARYRSRKLVSFLGYLAGALYLAVVFDEQLRGLVVALGVAGAGIALALQEVVASVAGWLAISFGRLYKVGDRIRIDGISGDVIDIGVLRTTLMETGDWVDADQYNGRIVRIANSAALKLPVYNESGRFPFLWDELRLALPLGADLESVRSVLLLAASRASGEHIAAAHTRLRTLSREVLIADTETRPQVRFALRREGLECTVRYVTAAAHRSEVRDRLATLLLRNPGHARLLGLEGT